MQAMPNNKFIFIRKFLLISILLFLSFQQFAAAQESNNSFIFQLKNKKYLNVQVCSDQIIRVRLAAKEEFTPTLMEKYGILKTDWNAVKTSSKKEKGNRIISTSGFQFFLNEDSGELSVKDATGKTIIQKILLFHQENQAVCKDLGQSLENYFGKEKHGGGIIGDSNYIGVKTDSEKSGGVPSVLQIALAADERFYGGGSTSRANIQHRGEALRIWATYQKTEIPMPFLLSSAGWGIYNNTTFLNFFDIGRFQKDNLFVYNASGKLDFYLMLGNSMSEVIKQYVTITGKPYLLPKWAYGLAFGGNTIENQFDMMNDAVRFREEKMPCEIFWIEPQWMATNYDFSTSKTWNQDKFPGEAFWEVSANKKKYENPTLFIHKLHGLGYHLALWLCINHDMSIAAEDALAVKAGKPQSGQEHWFDHLMNFVDQGVDGFKLDPGRTLDEHPERKYYNGSTDAEMHNLNQVLLPKQMQETFREHKGIRAFQHYCGGYAGTQHWGASTSGDNGGGKDALFDQLNLGLSGFVNTSADVLEGVTDNKAGMHLGFFLPWVQINSWYSLHHPWFMPPIEKETFRFYTQLRNSLSPYIYSAAIEGSQTGMPIVRAMPLVFPDDRKADNLIYQFMFGENLLVGVFSDSIYLPKGNWINYWSGEKMEGGKTVHCKIPENRGGLLFVKSGAIIPVQKPMLYIGEHPTDTLVLKVYPEKQSSYTLLEDDGKTFDYEKGSIAKTLFECIETDKNTEFIIHPTEGHYIGMPNSRTYQIEIASSKKPIQIKINGHKTEDWMYDVSGTVILQVNQNNTGIRVELFNDDKPLN